ncbi:MAG: FHA domain-containing protein [Myxococcaceae bacterium]|nr:FHA domain-containing protein [Myxococcaceae bacterium]
MGQGLSQYARRFLSNRAELERSLDCPVLVWETPTSRAADPALPTLTGTAQSRPAGGDAMVLEVRKVVGAANPFVFGVTVGRVDTNDIVIDDGSVSRFHAYLQNDAKAGKWVVVDAESKNGSWVAGRKIAPQERAQVGDSMRLRFGFVEVTFLEPKTFLARLAKAVGAAK